MQLQLLAIFDICILSGIDFFTEKFKSNTESTEPVQPSNANASKQQPPVFGGAMKDLKKEGAQEGANFELPSERFEGSFIFPGGKTIESGDKNALGDGQAQVDGVHQGNDNQSNKTPTQNNDGSKHQSHEQQQTIGQSPSNDGQRGANDGNQSKDTEDKNGNSGDAGNKENAAGNNSADTSDSDSSEEEVQRVQGNKKRKKGKKNKKKKEDKKKERKEESNKRKQISKDNKNQNENLSENLETDNNGSKTNETHNTTSGAKTPGNKVSYLMFKFFILLNWLLNSVFMIKKKMW